MGRTDPGAVPGMRIELWVCVWFVEKNKNKKNIPHSGLDAESVARNCLYFQGSYVGARILSYKLRGTFYCILSCNSLNLGIEASQRDAISVETENK